MGKRHAIGADGLRHEVTFSGLQRFKGLTRRDARFMQASASKQAGRPKAEEPRKEEAAGRGALAQADCGANEAMWAGSQV